MVCDIQDGALSVLMVQVGKRGRFTDRLITDLHAPELELARELIAARMRAGLTQGDVAALMGTTQSVVARIESGRGSPSMRTVQRFASAVGARAVVRMEPLTAG